MKNLTLILFYLLMIIGYSHTTAQSSVKEPIDGRTLTRKEGKMYEANAEEPYTGDIFLMFGKKGVRSVLSLKGGIPNGPTTSYYKNGKKAGEGNLKNGRPDGLMTEWYENGKKKKEENYKIGKRDGVFTEWYENGQKA